MPRAASRCLRSALANVPSGAIHAATAASSASWAWASHVTLPPDAAFDLFTGRMRAWWPFAGHSCGGELTLDVQFEPRVSGQVTELLRDGRSFGWGTLSEWSPPAAFAMSWHTGLPEERATQLRVSFAACEGGTEVRVLHDGWAARGSDAQAKRDQYDGGWPATLAALQKAAASG